MILCIDRVHFGTVYQSSRWTQEQRNTLTMAFRGKKHDEIWLMDTLNVRLVLSAMGISIERLRNDGGRVVSNRPVHNAATQTDSRENN